MASLLVMCLTAFAIWAPYLLSLQKEGGYAPIAANHAKYVVGISGWLDSASRQMASLQLMSRGQAVAVLVAISAAWSARWRGGRIQSGVWQLAVIAAVGLVLRIATPLVGLVVLSASGLVILFRRLVRRNVPVSAMIGACLLAAWWLGLVIATPGYWPYPRLLLPWLLSAWLAAAILLDEIASLFLAKTLADTQSNAEYDVRDGSAKLIGGLAIAGALLAIPVNFYCIASALTSNEIAADRLELISIAQKIRSEMDATIGKVSGSAASELPRVVYVFGEPALLFQLCAAGEPIVKPAQQIATASATLEGRELPTFLIAGPHAERDPGFAEAWPAAQKHWQLVAAFDYRPSAIVWLDLHDPRGVKRPPQEHSLRLYRFQSPAPSTATK